MKNMLLRRIILSAAGLMLGFCAYKTAQAMAFTFEVSGDSMQPVLRDGECGAGLNTDMFHISIRRGDIICFIPPDNPDVYYVKRVVGLPGETVDIEDGKIYVDGSASPIAEPYLDGSWTEDTGPYHFEVPEGCYLVLGDNRNDSYDSRGWDSPYVRYGSVRTKVMLVYGLPLRGAGGR